MPYKIVTPEVTNAFGRRGIEHESKERQGCTTQGCRRVWSRLASPSSSRALLPNYKASFRQPKREASDG